MKLFAWVAVVGVAVLACAAQGQIQQVPLSYALNALEPEIDNATMNFHYGTHYATYVNNTLAALKNATDSGVTLPVATSNLTALISNVRRLPSPLNTTIRNQGGGAWNHALYFKHLAPPGSPATQASAISAPLMDAIDANFGTLDNMTAELTAAAGKIFGSGWAWLCYTGNSTAAGGAGGLAITTTPNQDNPLMGQLPGAPPVTAAGCTPILGIDVWEHAYYLKNGPKRAAYLESFWKVVNWEQVSQNYASAVQGLELDTSEAAPQLMQPQAQAVSAGGSSSSTAVAAIAAGAAALLALV
ncbi:superoxide dismutase [Scenedesmus sp. NREL 46B-D3]|nr:superoxide dismutase [Scenedesmus sp. NREL 46B-D3]